MQTDIWILRWRMTVGHVAGAFNDAQVQIDYIFADKKNRFGKTWCDFAVAKTKWVTLFEGLRVPANFVSYLTTRNCDEKLPQDLAATSL